jgi:L-2-hydroxyglutarate oxidase LhgO
VEKVDATIVGAGVVGLAIASELSRKFKNVVVLERHGSFGQEISSRNSEVVHAGIYYPQGSLKARLCIEGARLLYSYCGQHLIPHSKIGKLIVATAPDELDRLEGLLSNGLKNGVQGLEMLDKNDIRKIEPHVTARAAIRSPNTGIVDTHSLMKALCNEAVSSGAIFSFNSTVNVIEKEQRGYVVGIVEEDYRFISRIVVNSAGLSSDRIAELPGMDADKLGYRLEYRKGSYFSYQGRSPVNMLIYPLPGQDRKSLGIHATLDLNGRLRFGPDSELVDSIDYGVDIKKKDIFYEAASKYINGLDKKAFIPDMSGIRPSVKGEGTHDFIIRHEADRDMSGFIDLIGIESPGLTASLAIAGYVKDLLNDI